jgi:hypothetical protein
MNTGMAANNDVAPPCVLKSVVFVDAVVQRWSGVGTALVLVIFGADLYCSLRALYIKYI